MAESSIVDRLMNVKQNSCKTYGQIAAETGLTNVYVAQLLRREAQLKPDTARILRAALPQLTEDLIQEMLRPPFRSYDHYLIQEPTVYRLKEAVMHFGESIKEIINEEFGDGIMSAIDFYCSVNKVAGVDGKDRVVVKFDGKYLPYTEPHTEQNTFKIEEATIEEIQLAFKQNELTSKQLVEYYIKAIKELNPKLSAVIEVNPDAQSHADDADRNRNLPGGCLSGLHGIPVMVKDNISTKDKLNTTAGSFALLGSVVPRHSGVVDRLRKAGAIILGKAGLTEWANFRSTEMPAGWSGRGGNVKNPYVLSMDPGGSSTGSAVCVAANLATVSLGTETSASIIFPCSLSCVVGIKPTLGLTSRAGVIPLTLRQDTVGPIGRTLSDAVYLLDEIVGYDPRDEITKEAMQYIPKGGYKQYLKRDGLKGKRLGSLWKFFNEMVYGDDPEITKIFQGHFDIMSQNGAVLLHDLDFPNLITIMNSEESGELLAFKYEFKRDLNVYLSNLLESPIRSLADAITFNENHADQEKLAEYGQDLFIESEKTTLPNSDYDNAVKKLANLSEQGFEVYMKSNNLDAMVAPEFFASRILGIGGYPGIVVPAGFRADGVPLGIMFAGLKGSDVVLIEIAYAFEQLTKARKPPKF